VFPQVRVQTQAALFDDSDAEVELPGSLSDQLKMKVRPT
jgi:hypothetical protein